MTNTPIIDDLINKLKSKGIVVDIEHNIYQDENKKSVINNFNKNKLRKSKRNFLRRD